MLEEDFAEAFGIFLHLRVEASLRLVSAKMSDREPSLSLSLSEAGPSLC